MSPLCIPFLPVRIVQQRSAGPVHWNINLYMDLSINALKFVHMMSTCWILSLSFTDVLDRPLEGVLHSKANSLWCSLQAFYLWVLQSTVHFGWKLTQIAASHHKTIKLAVLVRERLTSCSRRFAFLTWGIGNLRLYKCTTWKIFYFYFL